MKKLQVDFVCKVLQGQHLINAEQIQYIKLHEEEYRKQFQQKMPTDRPGGSDAVDLISAMKLKAGDGTEQLLTEELIMRVLAAYWKIPFLNIELSKISLCKLASNISAPFARKHLVVPVSISQKMLFVALLNPMDAEVLDTVRAASTLKIRPVVSTKTDILKAIDECYTLQGTAKTSKKQLASFDESVTAAEVELSPNNGMQRGSEGIRIMDDHADKNVVTAVNLMLQYACEQRANEIHIEPKQFYSQIRLRIDGMLYDVKQIPPEVYASMLLRVKALARMDISEKRKPQDGRTHFNFHAREMMLRISTMPMAFGEKIMIRILDPVTMLRHIDDLGFLTDDLERCKLLLTQSNGIVLIAGPPSSGKTTTIYSILDILAERGINITTIEDPIEVFYDKFNQVAIQPGAGFTFDTAIRHIVRQSPDVIMIGEIRDQETVENAMQAALLGHLVISSLHTYDAPSALVRLVKMGMPPFLVESTVLAVIAQRLLRRICPACGKPYKLSSEELSALHLSQEHVEKGMFLKGTGCIKCRGTGYLGQTAIFELMEVTDALRVFIHDNAGAHILKHTAVHEGMRTLRDQAVAKMSAGVTTCEEVLRVTGGLQGGKRERFKTTIALSDETQA